MVPFINLADPVYQITINIFCPINVEEKISAERAYEEKITLSSKTAMPMPLAAPEPASPMK